LSWRLEAFLKRSIFVLIFSSFSGAFGFAQHTYYISKSSGSDSNTATQAQSKSTPWAHLPGMPSCTANCASYTPVAGDRFILRGGDSWLASDLGINWQWAGTSTNPIYVGIDQTYYAGSSWSRPVFNCQNTGCAANQYGNIIWIAANYVSFDNIEFTGYQQQNSGGENLVAVYANYDTVENFYVHGWSRTSGSSAYNSYVLTNNWSGGGGIGTVFQGNVIDGSDSPNQDFMGGILHGDMVYNNVVRYVYNGMNGVFNNIHGNLVEYNYTASSGDHCNMIFPQDVFTGNTLWVYNNVIRHGGYTCAGSTLFTMGNSSCTTCTAYVYNNVLYDNEGDFDKGITIGSHTSTGTYYVYNNTVDTPGGYCMGNGESPPRSTTYYANTHCISPNPICWNTGTTCNNNGGNLSETETQANNAGYTSSETYAYSPISSSSPTVGIGNNYTSMCSGNLAALCSDTSYPTYDTTHHVVVMRTVNPRPSSGAWNAGAYEYAGSGDPPGPPSNLVALPQ